MVEPRDEYERAAGRPLPENAKNQIAEARRDIADNPITRYEVVCSYYRVWVKYPVIIFWMKAKLAILKFFTGRQ